jgi:hypothetical protein
MTENIPSEFKELQELIRKTGLLKSLGIAILYYGTLFFISVGIIMLYDQLFHIDFNSPSSLLIIAAVFTLVTLTDVVLIFTEKVTPTILVWVIILSIPLALYKLFKDADLFSLNKKSTPAKIRRYLFPVRVN